MRRPARLIAAAVVIAAAAAAVVATRGGDATTRANRVAAEAPSRSLAARFAVLSRAHSNRCGMPATALSAMAAGARLQGSCCFPMEYRSYVAQVRAIRRYAAVDVIPRDPYDIPISLAKRLIGYRSIKLTPEQQRTYDRAKPLSET